MTDFNSADLEKLPVCRQCGVELGEAMGTGIYSGKPAMFRYCRNLRCSAMFIGGPNTATSVATFKRIAIEAIGGEPAIDVDPAPPGDPTPHKPPVPRTPPTFVHRVFRVVYSIVWAPIAAVLFVLVGAFCILLWPAAIIMDIRDNLSGRPTFYDKTLDMVDGASRRLPQ